MSESIYPDKLPYPRLDPLWYEHVCQLGPRPLVVTGFFKVWMQGHFCDANQIEDQESPALKRDLWKPDEKTTGIAIESVTKWAPKLTEHRPGIIIKRNGWKQVRLGIDSRMMGTMSPDMQNRYTNVWQGSHTLYCIAGDGAEAEKLAAEVFRELNQFGPVIRKTLDLMRFEVMEVGELMKLKEDARENFVVPITVAYAYREEWIIVQERPLLKRVDMKDFQP